jgi:hypothetical protein
MVEWFTRLAQNLRGRLGSLNQGDAQICQFGDVQPVSGSDVSQDTFTVGGCRKEQDGVGSGFAGQIRKDCLNIQRRFLLGWRTGG